MFRTLIFGFIFTLIVQIFVKINCTPIVSGIERESTGKQLEFPNENEIVPGETIPREDTPNIPSIPRQFPGFPRRGGQSGDGLLNRIVNFFKRMLGFDSPTTNGDPYAPGGDGNNGNQPGERGVLGFIRRTFSGLINRLMSILGGNGGQPSLNPDAAEFPYQRPRLEPLRRN